MGLSGLPKTVERTSTGLREFSTRTILKVKNIGAYYVALVYTGLSKQLLSMTENGGQETTAVIVCF